MLWGVDGRELVMKALQIVGRKLPSRVTSPTRPLPGGTEENFNNLCLSGDPNLSVGYCYTRPFDFNP